MKGWGRELDRTPPQSENFAVGFEGVRDLSVKVLSM